MTGMLLFHRPVSRNQQVYKTLDVLQGAIIFRNIPSYEMEINSLQKKVYFTGV